MGGISYPTKLGEGGDIERGRGLNMSMMCGLVWN